MLVEIFLKFLICIVYIELLEVINLRGGGRETIQQVSLVPLLLHIQVKKRKNKSAEKYINIYLKRFYDQSISGQKRIHASHSSEAYLKVFESKDVKNANGFKVIFAFDPAVNLLNHPLEAACIKCHGQGVSAVFRLGERKHSDCLPLTTDSLGRQVHPCPPQRHTH